MKILHTSDWHVGKTLRGRSRADEQREVLAEIAGIGRDHQVDVALVAGDLFDTSQPSPEAEEIVYEALLELSRIASHVFVIAGNHDNPRRLKAIQPLLGLTNIHALPEVAAPSAGGVVSVQIGKTALRVALLPFVSQRKIVRAEALMHEDADDHDASYRDRLIEILEALSADADPKAVNILLAHAMVDGGKLGGGERAAHTIFDYAVPAPAFPSTFHYVALGHLHRAQKLAAAQPMWYSGSPLQLDFGETGDTKSVNLVTATPGKPASVEQIALTSGRRLKRISGTLDDLEKYAETADDSFLLVEVEAKPALGLADRIRELLPHAVDVRLLIPQTQATERAERDTTKHSPSELFASYLAEKGSDTSDVLELFNELLDDEHATT